MRTQATKILFGIIILTFISTSVWCQYTSIPVGQEAQLKIDQNDKRIDFSPQIDLLKQNQSFTQPYANMLPLFCKIEYNFEKSSKINLRVRLGDLSYVNKLENK